MTEKEYEMERWKTALENQGYVILKPKNGTTDEGETNLMTTMKQEFFYEKAKLPLWVLEKFENYVKAADAQKESSHAEALFEYLLQRQGCIAKEPDDSTCDDSAANLEIMESFGKEVTEPNAYVSIIASSGTGKTQLAATASLNYKDRATTVYLNFGDGRQAFYQPHTTIARDLFKSQILKFLGEVVVMKEIPVTANKIKGWAEDRDNGRSAFVRILHRLLVGEETDEVPAECKLTELKKLIKEKTYLVFLDEVPPRNENGRNNDDFNVVLCLRDTLRYLGIAPILMSTHTGAQDYVVVTSRDSSSSWMHIISMLPPYCPFADGGSNIILPSERPLVLGMALSESNKRLKLPQLVSKIRTYLQRAKPQAWRQSPALQLVQLFCTNIEIEQKMFSVSHSLVGHHFGCLQQPVGTNAFGASEYSSFEAGKFAENLSVAPVSAQFEPLLYLALVTWDESMLKTGRSEHFPLIDESNRAMTVRQAYENCSGVFTSSVTYDNQQAQKANGDLLEVLVHASMTLASMKTSVNGGGYLAGVHLKEYLPLVRKLMLAGTLESLPEVPRFLEDSLDMEEWINIPALGGSDSGLPAALADETRSCIGFLTRPKNNAKVDGELYVVAEKDGEYQKNDTYHISVECKNYTDGVPSKVLREVFKRITSSIKVCFVFVSSLKGEIFRDSKLASVQAECFKENFEGSLANISVFRWKRDDEEPTFLKIGNEEFKATEKTKLLVAIMEVGLVEEKKWVCRKRKHQPCANLPWDIGSSADPLSI